MVKPLIRLVRPLNDLYASIGGVLIEDGDSIYYIGGKAFVSRVMADSGGSIDPRRVAAIYRELLEEAGVDDADDKDD